MVIYTTLTILSQMESTQLAVTLLPPTMKLRQGYVFTGICDSVHEGDMHSRDDLHSRGVCVAGGMHYKGACMTEACVAGGVHGRGHAWQGSCMVGGVHGGGHAWQGWLA